MDNLVIHDGFAPYFERREDRLRDETCSRMDPVPAEKRRPHSLYDIDPRAIVASGSPARRRAGDAGS